MRGELLPESDMLRGFCNTSAYVKLHGVGFHQIGENRVKKPGYARCAGKDRMRGLGMVETDVGCVCRAAGKTPVLIGIVQRNQPNLY